jgi:predicted negative regulator of RcsB-dependent stress response
MKAIWDKGVFWLGCMLVVFASFSAYQDWQHRQTEVVDMASTSSE